MKFRQTFIRGTAALLIGLCTLTAQAMALTDWCGEADASAHQHAAHSDCHATAVAPCLTGHSVATAHAHHDHAADCGCIQMHIATTEVEQAPRTSSAPPLTLDSPSTAQTVHTNVAPRPRRPGERFLTSSQSAAALTLLRSVILRL